MTSPFIINHLWQSSCFALLAGLLAFALRKNSPKVRYWVWLGASLKFLIPFALLVSLGSVVPRPARHPVSVVGSCFPEHPRSNRGTFSPTVGHCSSACACRLGAGRDRRRVGPRVFGNHAGTMPQLVANSSSICEPARPSNSRSPYRRSSRLARRSRASLVFCARSWFCRPNSWNT